MELLAVLEIHNIKSGRSFSMKKDLSIQELTSIVGGKKACSTRDAIASAAIGAIGGIGGGIWGSLGGAIKSTGQCIARNYHGIH